MMWGGGLTVRGAEDPMGRERLLPLSLALVATAFLVAGSMRFFTELHADLLRVILGIGIGVTLPGFAGAVLFARSQPLLAFAFAIFSILMRLTGVALIGIWLQAKGPESLRHGLLAYLTFVGGFLLVEILALSVSGLHRFLPAAGRSASGSKEESE